MRGASEKALGEWLASPCPVLHQDWEESKRLWRREPLTPPARLQGLSWPSATAISFVAALTELPGELQAETDCTFRTGAT